MLPARRAMRRATSARDNVIIPTRCATRVPIRPESGAPTMLGAR